MKKLHLILFFISIGYLFSQTEDPTTIIKADTIIKIDTVAVEKSANVSDERVKNYDFYNDYLPSLQTNNLDQTEIAEIANSDTLEAEDCNKAGIISVRLGAGSFLVALFAVGDIPIYSNLNFSIKYMVAGERITGGSLGFGLGYVVTRTNNFIFKPYIYVFTTETF